MGFGVVSLLNPVVVLTAGPTISAGTQSQATGLISFANSNNVTFGLSNGVMTASAAGGGAGGGAGTLFSGTNISGTVDTNGISLSVAAPGGGAAVNFIAGTTNANLQTVSFADSNNVSFGLNGSKITASASYPAQTVDTNKAGVGYTSTTQVGSTVGVTQNTAGLSAAWPPFLTTYSAQTNQTVASGNIAGVGTTFGGTNVSASMTLNSAGLALSLSAPAPGGGGGTTSYYNQIADSASTVTSGTVVFANSNGLSFGLNGSTMTASYAGQTNQTAASGNIAGVGTTFGGTNVSASMTLNSVGLVLSLSAPAGGGGAAATVRDWLPYQMAQTTNTSIGAGSVFFCPLLPQANMSFSVAEIISSNAAGTFTGSYTKGMTLSYGLYSENGASLSLMSSSSVGFTLTQASSNALRFTYSDGAGSFSNSTAQSTHPVLNVMKALSLPFAGTMSAGGLYFWGQNMSTSSAGSNVAVTFSQVFNAEVATSNIGGWGGTQGVGTNNSIIQEPYGFIRSATSAGLPSSCAYSDMSAYSNYQPYLYFEG